MAGIWRGTRETTYKADYRVERAAVAPVQQRSRAMDKTMLKEYEQACAIIREAESGVRVMKWQLARASTIRAAVDENIKDAPLRIQRMIRFKYMEGMTWEEVAKNIGGRATEDSVRKEIERFLKK